MLELEQQRRQLEEKMKNFIWDFKIYDNILYNLNLLESLVSDYNDFDKRYCKPISILAVSILEALMVDLTWRLYSATTHFPKKANIYKRKEEIKSVLRKETQVYQKIYEGKKFKARRLRNFGFNDLISFFEEFKLLGANADNYDSLRKFGYFRNRVHIKNYHNNFEKDESRVFTEPRTQRILDAVSKFINYFNLNYSRPWK